MIGNFSSYPDGLSREKLEISDTGFIIIGDERIDIRSLHDIATPAQINALAFMLRYLAKSNESTESLEAMALRMRGLTPIKKSAENTTDFIAKVNNLYAQIQTEGLNIVDTGFFAGINRFMDLPRSFELLAATNRMRGIRYFNFIM
jgi:hypothetical protein